MRNRLIQAMDRDLAHDDAGAQADHNRAYHEPVYFSALIRLADDRIAPELARRAEMSGDAAVATALHRYARRRDSDPKELLLDEFSVQKTKPQPCPQRLL